MAHNNPQTEDELQEKEDELKTRAEQLKKVAEELRLKRLQLRLERLIGGIVTDVGIRKEDGLKNNHKKLELMPWPKDDYRQAAFQSSGKDMANWCYDTDNHRIYYPTTGKSSISVLGDTEVVSIVLHEIGHARYSTAISPQLIEPPQYAFAQMCNAFEDIRIEAKMMFRFPGTYDFLSELYTFIDKGISDDAMKSFPEYVNYLFNTLRVRWGLEPKFSEKAKIAHDRTEEFIKTIPLYSSSESMVQALSKEVWPVIKDLIKEDGGDGNGGNNQTSKAINQRKIQLLQKEMTRQEALNKMRQEHEASGDGTPFNVPPEIQEEEEQNRHELKALENQIKAASGGLQTVADLKDAMKDMSTAKLSDIDKKEEDSEKNGRELAQQLQGDKHEDGDMGSPLAKPSVKIEGYAPEVKVTFEQLYAQVEPYVVFFTQKMRSIMKDNRLTRHGGNFRSGKLNTRELAKWKCGKTKLFTKQILRSHKDYSVSLVVDESGSMCGDEIYQAALSAVLLSEVLHRCKIDFEIVGFNRTTRIYKSFKDKYTWVTRRNLESLIPSTSSNNAGCTNDAFELASVNERLKGRRGERIIIMLCDGSPNPSGDAIPVELRKGRMMNKQTTSDFDLEKEVAIAGETSYVIGVGIKTNVVQKYYPHNAVVEDVQQLPTSILNLLRKRIKRG